MVFGVFVSIVSQANNDDTINASGPEIPKCVKRSGQIRPQTRASDNASPESSCVHISFVRKLDKDGPSCVTLCPSALAKAYPSPVDPV